MRVTSFIACAALATGAAAQPFPSKPLRLVVPFASGGVADQLGRILAEKLQASLGQPVVVVNRDGAGTIVGADMVAKAVPDGYTLFLGNDAMTINAGSGRKLPYDTVRDLAPITLVYQGRQVLVVSHALGVNSTAEFLARARANPDKLTYGSSGVGSSIHLATASFQSVAGVRLVHVPFKGVAPAMTEVVAGRVDVLFANVGFAAPFIKGGKVKTLALAAERRSGQFPDIPTLRELGLDFTAGSWYGLLAPAGTPSEVIARLNQDTVAILKSDDMRDKMVAMGGEPLPNSPDQFATLIREEIKRWGDAVRTHAVKLE